MKPDNYITVIKTQSPTPNSITPVEKIIGNKSRPSPVFMVTQWDKTFMYKISDARTAYNNLMMAQKLLQSGIPVPDSKIFIGIGGIYFEKYEMIPGQTLSYAIQNNTIPSSQIPNILHDVFIYDEKISRIQPGTSTQQMFIADKCKIHNSKDFGNVLANCYYIINKRITTYGNISMHHTDLNPSNILLDGNGNFTAFLDLDGIALCDEYTMLTQINTTWPHISTKQIVNLYQDIYKKPINTNRLQKLTILKKNQKNITTILRKISKHINRQNS